MPAAIDVVFNLQIKIPILGSLDLKGPIKTHLQQHFPNQQVNQSQTLQMYKMDKFLLPSHQEKKIWDFWFWA